MRAARRAGSCSSGSHRTPRATSPSTAPHAMIRRTGARGREGKGDAVLAAACCALDPQAVQPVGCLACGAPSSMRACRQVRPRHMLTVCAAPPPFRNPQAQLPAAHPGRHRQAPCMERPQRTQHHQAAPGGQAGAHCMGPWVVHYQYRHMLTGRLCSASLSRWQSCRPSCALQHCAWQRHCLARWHGHFGALAAGHAASTGLLCRVWPSCRTPT